MDLTLACNLCVQHTLVDVTRVLVAQEPVRVHTLLSAQIATVGQTLRAGKARLVLALL